MDSKNIQQMIDDAIASLDITISCTEQWYNLVRVDAKVWYNGKVIAEDYDVLSIEQSQD